ncbi:MAG: hypothetical protein LC098_00785 [Burkholderiales bacterium]|nr:hypothetical protein [Burkholderiales bacterium]
MASFSIWHWLIVLMIVLMLLGPRESRVRWEPLIECGAGLLIAWLLLAVLRGS